MEWATRRRVMVLIVLAIIAIAFGATIVISATHKAPSCVDGVQNQNEGGIDCGGPCAYLCTEREIPPTVLFTKAVSNGAGRIDVIAAIENKNTTAAARSVPYRVRLYAGEGSMLHEVTGTLDLPPAAIQFVFVPGLASSQRGVLTAFLEIDPTAPKWFTLRGDPRILPSVSNPKLGGSTNAPRIEATLSNPTITPLTNVPVVTLVRDAVGNVMSASATVVPLIDRQSAATAVFTWNGAFTGTPTKIEVVPVVPLPSDVGPT